MIGGNNQLTITLPKIWTIKNNLKKGDYVGICILNEPTISILEKIDKCKGWVKLTDINNKSIEGKVNEFVEDGVLLDSNRWMKFTDIKKIQRRLKL